MSVIRINRIHHPVTTLGPGRRVGVWVQGCGIGCPGCVARDTWSHAEGTTVEVDDLLRSCLDLAGSETGGLTISGGEPFEQPGALGSFLDLVRKAEGSANWDVLVYSGFRYTKIRREWPDILARIDALIPEPFVEDLPRGRVWRGSTNQPLILLSRRGFERYRSCVGREYDGKGDVQFAVHSNRIDLIGIPDRQDMNRLELLLRKRGVRLQATSWKLE